MHADGLCVLPGLIDAHTHYHLISRGTVTADSFVKEAVRRIRRRDDGDRFRRS